MEWLPSFLKAIFTAVDNFFFSFPDAVLVAIGVALFVTGVLVFRYLERKYPDTPGGVAGPLILLLVLVVTWPWFVALTIMVTPIVVVVAAVVLGARAVILRP